MVNVDATTIPAAQVPTLTMTIAVVPTSTVTALVNHVERPEKFSSFNFKR